MSNHGFEAKLAEYSNFAECLLLDYWSENYCRDFVVLMSSIWESPGVMRRNLDRHCPVHLRFRTCARVLIQNRLAESMLQEPDRVNWGMNEIAAIRFEPLLDGMHRFVIRWESERKIEIDCFDLQIDRGAPSPDIQAKYPW